MNDLSSKFIIAITSALFAFFIKVVYDFFTKRKDINRKTKALIDIIENVIIVNLERHKLSYNILDEHYRKAFGIDVDAKLFLTHALDPKILSFFSNNDLIEIMKKKNAEISLLYESIIDLDLFKEHLPSNCKSDYTKKIFDTMNKYKLLHNSDYQVMYKDQNYIDELKFYQKGVLEYMEEQIKNIDDLILNFNKVLIKLKN